jgi:hypothetical protein
MPVPACLHIPVKQQQQQQQQHSYSSRNEYFLRYSWIRAAQLAATLYYSMLWYHFPMN